MAPTPGEPQLPICKPNTHCQCLLDPNSPFRKSCPNLGINSDPYKEDLISREIERSVDMAHSYSPEPGEMVRNRLPTLFEVLARRTMAPVDLYFFYIYMRDEQRAVDYLDFWLDVAQHMSMCRVYVRELRRSVMVGTPDAHSKRSSALLDNIGNLEGYDRDAAGPSMLKSEKKKSQDAQLSEIIREQGHSPSGSTGSAPRPSFMSSPQVNNSDSNSPEHTIAREDIRAKAQDILATYILPGALRQIILPGVLVDDITTAIEQHGRDDPEVFDAAKDYVFQAMERDAFPGFLRAKALGNITPASHVYRLILGLLGQFAGVWAGSVLCMLGESRQKRIWMIIPFFFAAYGLTCWQYKLDPFLALVGYSEYEPLKASKVQEPFIRKLLLKRSFTALAWIFIVTAAFSCLFIFVPSHYIGS